MDILTLFPTGIGILGSLPTKTYLNDYFVQFLSANKLVYKYNWTYYANGQVSSFIIVDLVAG